MAIKDKISSPKITFDRFGQIFFVFKHIGRIIFDTQPKLFIVTFLVGILWGISSVPGFYLEKLIIDKLISGIGNQNINSVLYSVGIFVGLYLALQLLRNFLGGINSVLRSTLSRYLDMEIHILLGEKLAELDLATIEDPDFRDRFEKIEKESGRRAWGLMLPLTDIPNYLAGFISAVAVLVFVSPWISLGVILVSIPKFFVHSRFIKKEYELNTKLSFKRRIWRWTENFLVKNRNFMELKLLNLTKPLTKKMKEISVEIFEKYFDIRKQREKTRIFSDTPSVIYEFAVSIYLALQVLVQKITIGSFQLYIRSLRSAETNFSGLVRAVMEIYENYIYVTDLVWFLNLEPKTEKKTRGKEKIGDTVLPIEFNDVRFKYRDDAPWILKGVGFKIEPGEKIAIVGENGAGKTTLVKLVARFYDPQKGTVLIGGRDLKDIDIASWRENLAILFQMFEIYPFSVKEAIGYGDIKRMKNLDEIKEAARKSGIDEYVEGLPLKYDNPLSPEFDKGVQPSLGQWKRFGLSRILFRKNANVIILDEPTSNVDPEAEEKIFKELAEVTKNKILIFITQRFSTVRIADRIFVVHDGKIIEQGTHKELMEKNGKYARMFNLQAKTFLEN